MRASLRRRVASSAGSLVWCAFSAYSAPSYGEALQVKLHTERCTPLVAVVRAHAQLTDAAAARPAAVEVAIPDKGSTTLNLAAGFWLLTPDIPGCWAGEKTIEVRKEPGRMAVRFDTWPIGHVRARMQTPSGVATPSPFKLSFEPPDEAQRKGEDAPAPHGVTVCDPSGQDIVCEVPSARLDLILRAKGYAPHYLWDVSVGAGAERYLGLLRLLPVNSVSGRVRIPTGPAARTKVMLAGMDGRPLRSPRTKSAPQFSVTTNHRGFYQMLDVPAGDYQIIAESAGWALATAWITVPGPPMETVVDVLRLRPPERLDLLLEPATHPSGRPWSVEVLAHPMAGRYKVVADGAASQDGRFTTAALAPGPHRITLHIGATRWWSQEIEVPTSESPLRIEVALARLRGLVTLGNKPLVAMLHFGGVFGAVSFPFTSDEEGRFEGLFPREGAGGEWDVDVEADEPPVRRTLHRVKLDADGADYYVALKLPGTTLKGVVVSDNGLSVEGALLTCQAYADVSRIVNAVSDTKGRFEFNGLPPGEVRVTARTRNGFSAGERLTLKADEVHQTKLVLASMAVLSGRVVNPDGEGVPAATITATPIGTELWASGTRRTEVDGTFEVKLPSEAREVALSVSARGFAFRTLRLPVTAGRLLLITLDRLAGTLVLELDPSLAGPTESPKEFLVSGGSHIPVAFLKGWAAVNLSADDQPYITPDGRLTLPQMHPGAYSLCVTPIQDSWRLPMSSMDACATGYLALGDTLTLRSPSLRQ